MRYIPHTDEEIRQMLDTIGVDSVDELFESIPGALRERARSMQLEDPMGELALTRHLESLARKNRVSGQDVDALIGAGCYDHVVPQALNQLLLRAEFLTSYTPYQPEISQGTTKAIFEFQSMVAEVLGMPIANASMYDGAHAAAEAALMAQRSTRRSKILVASSVHPEYRQVIQTYLRAQDDVYVEFGFDEESGRIRLEDLEAVDLNPKEVACVLFQSPNFFGVFEDPREIIDWAKEHKILTVATFNEPHAFALARPPGSFDVDICAGEAMGFGIGQAFGGPSLGVFAAREKLLRTMPGRLAGQTMDSEGREGYVLTLSTREQHIRREKATSNICTNQGLMALAAAIYLSLMGKEGFREIAQLNMARARFALEELEQRGIGKRTFQGPFFNEFVIELPCSAREMIDACLQEDVICGFDLGSLDARWERHLLMAVTEMTPRDKVLRVIDVMAKTLNR